MIKYPDGTQAQVGDIVGLSRDTANGVVREVIGSLKKARAWNLDEKGLMTETKRTGLTFYPFSSLDSDEIRFISRQGGRSLRIGSKTPHDGSTQ